MIRVTATAYPDSGIQNTTFVARGLPQTVALPIASGSFLTSSTELPSLLRLSEFQLVVEAKDAVVSALARNISPDSHIHFIGISESNFMAVINHNVHLPLAPTYQLHCTPHHTPVTGPG